MPEQRLDDNGSPRDDAGDAFLRVFIRGLNAAAARESSNDADTTIGVTLWVGGSIVSGQLVGSATYFRGLKETFREATGGDDSFDGLFDTITTELSKDADNDEGPIRFVHLREARTFVAGQEPIPANQGMWWRGRLDHIDGFAFGLLSVSN